MQQWVEARWLYNLLQGIDLLSFGTGMICDLRQEVGHWFSKRQKSQSFKRRLWKIWSFQIIAGMLSGRNALADLSDLRTTLSSLIENEQVGISKSSDIRVLGKECDDGAVGSFDRRFFKVVGTILQPGGAGSTFEPNGRLGALARNFRDGFPCNTTLFGNMEVFNLSYFPIDRVCL